MRQQVMCKQDDSATTPIAKETTDQEPQDDAREDADNLYAKHATDATLMYAWKLTLDYLINIFIPVWFI